MLVVVVEGRVDCDYRRYSFATETACCLLIQQQNHSFGGFSRYTSHTAKPGKGSLQPLCLLSTGVVCEAWKNQDAEACLCDVDKKTAAKGSDSRPRPKHDGERKRTKNPRVSESTVRWCTAGHGARLAWCTVGLVHDVGCSDIILLSWVHSYRIERGLLK